MTANRCSLIGLAFVFSFLTGFGQTAGNYSFFKGDTLNGFDLSACLVGAQKAHIAQVDMKGYIKQNQQAFVNTKYNLHESNRQSSQIDPIVMTACSNLDFETGTMTGWTGLVGENDNSLMPIAVTTAGFQSLGINASDTLCSYTTLVNTGIDRWGNFPISDPAAGSWAVRLGGENANVNFLCNTPAISSPGESIQQTFAVTASNNALSYNYAVVLEQAPHAPKDCPYFRAEILNATGDTIPGMQLYISSASNRVQYGLLAASKINGYGDTLFYCSWKTKSFNLTPYIGQNATIRFTAAGCTQGGHMGYAYIDASCSALPTDIKNLSNNVAFAAYPNPFTNQLTIESGIQFNDGTLILYDVVGKEIRRQEKVSTAVDWDLSALSPGVYFIFFKTSQGTSVKELIKE